MRRVILLLAVAAACAKSESVGSGSANAEFKPLEVGAQVPVYAAATLAGDTIRVGGAEPPTVLNVWATWCTSCQEEMAALDSLHHEYAARGLRVIAVSVDNGDIGRVRKFATTNKLELIVAHDPASTINQTFEVVGVPTTFVIGKDGKLLWRHTGNITDVMAEARASIGTAVAQ